MTTMTARDLARELNTSPPTARRFLRSIAPEGKGATRWEIDTDELKALKKKFKRTRAGRGEVRSPEGQDINARDLISDLRQDLDRLEAQLA